MRQMRVGLIYNDVGCFRMKEPLNYLDLGCAKGLGADNMRRVLKRHEGCTVVRNCLLGGKTAV
jgi:predicted TPR repeat methyltransferase